MPPPKSTAPAKLLLPGLIDVNVHLSAPRRGFTRSRRTNRPRRRVKNTLSRPTCTCGVTAVRNRGEIPSKNVLKEQGRIRSGERFRRGAVCLRAAVYRRREAAARRSSSVTGSTNCPRAARKAITQRHPSARRAARQGRLARKWTRSTKRGVDAIKVVMDDRLAPALLNAIVAEAHRYRLPVSVNAAAAEDVRQCNRRRCRLGGTRLRPAGAASRSVRRHEEPRHVLRSFVNRDRSDRRFRDGQHGAARTFVGPAGGSAAIAGGNPARA